MRNIIASFVIMSSGLTVLPCCRGHTPTPKEATKDDGPGDVSLSIYNGDAPESPANKKTMILLYKPSTTGKSSGTNVVYPRCVLTSKHIELKKGEPAWNQINIVNGIRTKKQQSIADFREYPTTVPKFEYSDLAVVWLTNRVQEDSIVEPDGYKPVKILPTLSNDSIYAKVHGYGMSQPNELDYVLKQAVIAMGDRVIGQAPKTGSQYKFYKTVNSTKIICHGDSGGALTPMAGLSEGIVGVIEGGDNYDCDGAPTNYEGTAIGFFEPPFPGKDPESNLAWVTENIETLCAKSIQFSATNGKVTGSITPAQKITLAPSHAMALKMNGAFNTATGDLAELIHENQGFTVVAEGDHNYDFKRWETGANSDHPHCACIGQGKTCTKKYADIGTYGPEHSADDDTCVAVFELVPPTGGGAMP